MESDEGRAKLLREARAHAAKYHRSPADPFVIRVLIFFLWSAADCCCLTVR